MPIIDFELVLSMSGSKMTVLYAKNGIVYARDPQSGLDKVLELFDLIGWMAFFSNYQDIISLDDAQSQASQ